MGVPMQIATRRPCACRKLVHNLHGGNVQAVELVAFGPSKFSASAFNLESQP